MSVGRRHRPQRDARAIGALALVVTALAVAASIAHDLPFVGGGHREVTAEFATARQVTSDTPVRVKGVEVGKVAQVRYDEGREVSVVTFRLTDDDVRLRRDATAALRWRTALGGRMELALDPGSPSAPPLDGSLIPRRRTRIQAELEDVTRVLDGRGTAGTRAMLQELPRALAGDDAGRAIDALGPALRPFPRAMRALRGERDGDLPGLVRSGSRALRAMDDAQRSLGGFVDGAAATMGTTARRAADLRATFAAAPGALAATRRTTGEVDRTLPRLDALVADLRPATRRLAPVLARTRPAARQLDRVLRDARPLVRALRPAVDRLARASRPGRRVLSALDPTLRRLEGDLLPFLEARDDDLELPVYQLIGPTISSLNAAGGLFHDTGHIVNFPVQPSETSATLVPCALFLTDPTAAQKVRCELLERGLRTMLSGRARP
ncbi:MAG TPA: MlaD family protein [Baekduia sp.]|nr:MlaD family protein [Baekduia sp.]